MFDLELMRQLSSVAGVSEAEIEQLRQNREEDAGGGSSFEGTGTPAHDIPVLSNEEVAALISPEARDLVVGFEVGSRTLYERKYIEPEWPKGASGVTIGIGYDVGYHSAEELKDHWRDLIADADIQRLLRASGVKGSSAGAIISDFRGIRVPWDAAMAAYERSTMPKYGRWVLSAFPNAVDLKGHAFGALFSLVFNRGAKMDGDRRREMRNIREACKAKTFDGVPQEFLDMRKLWAGQGLSGLIKRREAEAVLFAKGLEAMRAVAVASASVATAGLQVESVQDESRFDGDGLYYEEDDDGPIAKEAVNNWEGVRWAESDDDAHDYQHIADRALAGKTFEFDARALELLIKSNHFEPIRDAGRIVFGLRGAELVTSLTSPGPMMQQLDRPSLTLRDCRPNHKDFRCVLGVYDLTTGRLSGFASSTVPNRKAVAAYATNQSSGNMTPTGCYRFTVGWHLISKPERKIPGCLVEAGRQKCVHRSPKNKYYDLLDSWENHKLHGNNLHPAKSESSAAFSSWGCLVVSGNYACTGARENGTHTGEWAQFRKALGLTKPGSGDHGLLFDVVMVTGLEATIASDLIKRGVSAEDPSVQDKLGRLRQGSKGEQVKVLQRGLGLPETGVFGHEVAKAWADRQAKDFAGKSQGTYGPVSDAHYKWGVFAAPSAPGPVVVATIAGTQGTVAAVRRLETLAGSPAPDAAGQSLESLYYEIGLHTSAIQRNPSANTSTLESLNSGQLQSLQLEFGWADLQAKGSDLVRAIERQLQDKLCSNNAAAMVNRDELGAKVEDAKRKSQGSLKNFIAKLIATLIPGGAFLPDKLNEMIADAIIAVVAKPLADGAGQVFSNQVDFTAQWLCGRWCDRLGVPDQVAAAPAAAVVAAPLQQASPAVPAAPLAASVAPVTLLAEPAAQAPPPPLKPATSNERVAEFLSNIEKAASGASPDTAAVRSLIRQLNAYLAEKKLQLTGAETDQLLKALSDTSVMDQIAGAIGADPYVLMTGVETALKKSPPDRLNARKLTADLHEILANARAKIQPEAVKRFLKVLRDAKMFDELSWMADRFAARDPKLIGVVTTSYAQGLIDSGRLVAGIEMLQAAEELDLMTGSEVQEAAGILGRGHKQIYVNHIKTESDAIALKDSFGAQLTKAIESYGRAYDPSKPGDNAYQGINCIALLKRAERDRISLEATSDAGTLARAMIAALEPKAKPDTENPWDLATLAEAYLAVGYIGKAADYYAMYANHPAVTAFQLNGTVRQLEEVWQIKCGAEGAEAILTNLKAALAQKENGFVKLDPCERRAIAKAENVEFQSTFETVTQGGRLFNFGLLKRIVTCGASVAAIQEKMGQSGRTVGTGFLIKGSDFSSMFASDKSYIITNAHVVWDPAQGQGSEDNAILPDETRVIFENDLIDGLQATYTCKVVWQSPSSQLDAVLLELDKPVTHCKPLDLAPVTAVLTVACETAKGSKLAVLGHPNGGNLSIGVLGTLDQMQGTLVDRGARANTKDPIFLHYMTPTEPGNSGSPVFEADTWKVVGLHHAGFIQSKGGIPKLDGKAGSNMANEGIWIESIRTAVGAAFTPPPAAPQKPESVPKGRKKWFS